MKSLTFSHVRSRSVLLRFVGVVLILVSASKFFFIFSGAKVLDIPDPLTGLSYRNLHLIAAIAELLVGIPLLVANPTLKLPSLLAGWLGVAYAGFRISNWLFDLPVPCKCLGQLLSWWPWAARHETAFAWATIALLVGSSALCIALDRVNSETDNSAKNISLESKLTTATKET